MIDHRVREDARRPGWRYPMIGSRDQVAAMSGITSPVALLWLALLAIAVVLIVPRLRERAPTEITTRLSLADALGTGDPAGYARALEPLPFVFPADHGPHPAFRTEWWYLTGNLGTADGRRFGYQLTIFRSALAPDTAIRASAWATTQAYMAHFALTDAAGHRFHAFDRFARGALGLAGAQAEPFRVWLEEWEMRSELMESAGEVGSAAPTSHAEPRGTERGMGRDDNRKEQRTAEEIFPLRVRARNGDIGIELRLEAGKPIVLHGERGLSAKGPEPGNASYYYSFTRLPTGGTITLADGDHAVTGASWFDREWGTSRLSAGVVGWDWFALQLEDGTDLMAFQLRRADGSAALRGGTLVEPDGATRGLDGSGIAVRVTDTWASPIDGARYPSSWRLGVPAHAIDVEITPLLAQQELDVAVRYWEGAVTVTGMRGGRVVRGLGYVELTGYAENVAGRAR